MRVICNIFLIGLSVLLLLRGRVQAYVVSASYQKIGDAYVRTTEVRCEVDDTESCFHLCQQERFCQRVEPFCRNCAGTASPLLRQLFTEISKVFKIKGTNTFRFSLLQFLKFEKYVLLDMKSIFDYYNSADSEIFVQELRQFCGSDSQDSLLAVSLDAVNQPQELKYVLCRDSLNQTQAFEVESRVPSFIPLRLFTPIVFSSRIADYQEGEKNHKLVSPDFFIN